MSELVRGSMGGPTATSAGEVVLASMVVPGDVAAALRANTGEHTTVPTVLTQSEYGATGFIPRQVVDGTGNTAIKGSFCTGFKLEPGSDDPFVSTRVTSQPAMVTVTPVRGLRRLLPSQRDKVRIEVRASRDDAPQSYEQLAA